MVGRRHILALGLAMVVAGCVQPSPDQILTPEVASSIRVVEVAAYPSRFDDFHGRNPGVTTAQAVQDIQTAIEKQLAPYRGQRRVILQVAVNDFFLAKPGTTFLVGGANRIRGKIRLLDARTGEELLKLTEIADNAESFGAGSLISLAQIQSADEEYRATIANFAAGIEARLFGAPEE